MRTIQQYVDWMKLCQQLDPDCIYFVHHEYRKNRQTKVDLEEFETTPLKLSDVERKLYVKGPEGLFELDT